MNQVFGPFSRLESINLTKKIGGLRCMAQFSQIAYQHQTAGQLAGACLCQQYDTFVKA
jgi:hypothetical protein